MYAKVTFEKNRTARRPIIVFLGVCHEFLHDLKVRSYWVGFVGGGGMVGRVGRVGFLDDWIIGMAGLVGFWILDWLDYWNGWI